MHGIILKTLQAFVVDTYGDDAWLAVQEAADIEEKVYVPVTVYPDGDVYEIARTAGNLTDQSPRTILTQYGKWVVPALLETYRSPHRNDEWEGLELIANIQRFHTSLRTRDMTTLTTPRIRSERIDENRVQITYDSDRKLCDVARGAIQGVAERFDEELVAEELTCMHEGDDACQFDIRRSVPADPGSAVDARSDAESESKSGFEFDPEAVTETPSGGWMTEPAAVADGGSPLPRAVQSDTALGFGVAVALTGLLVVAVAAVALDVPTTAVLGVGVAGVIATAGAGAAIAAVSDARAAPRQRDALREGIADVTERTGRLENEAYDVSFRTDRDDEFAGLEASLAEIRNQLAASERTDRSLDDLERTVATHAEMTRAVAAGDLTRRFEQRGTHDAIDELAGNSNAMLADLEDTFGTLKSFSGEVVTYSRELKTSMETVRAEGERTSEALTAVVADNREQNDQLRSVAAEMESFSTTIEEIAATASEVADTADRTARVGQEGSEAATDAIEGMDVIDAETERTLEEIEGLEAEAERIDELVESISDIAEQTNMLALNANIEATRSDNGGGEGFGAVADEIQNLSEEVYDSVQAVEERLEGLKDRAMSAADEVRTSRGRIEESVADVEDAANALERIADLAGRTNDGVQEISAATEEQASATEEVVVLVESAAETSDDTAATSARAARRASAQAEALSHVARSATVLTEQAGELNAQLERYVTESGYDLPEARTADDVDPETVSTATPTPETIGDGGAASR